MAWVLFPAPPFQLNGWNYQLPGAEQSISNCTAPVAVAGTTSPQITCPRLYDQGSVSVRINGTCFAGVSYGQGSNGSTMAPTLASNINSNSSCSAIVSASYSANVVTITAKGTGTATNYSLSSSCSYDTTDFSRCSFTAVPSGSTMTGGQNAVYTTQYDSGTVSITVNGSQASSYTYGQSDTASSVASSLVSHFSSSVATASLNGTSITITANSTGASTNYPISTSSSSSNGFSPPSFSTSNTGMSGGTSDILYNLGLNYEPDGDVLSSSDSANGNWTYNYDWANRVLGANQNSGQNVYSFAYDPVGNRTQQIGPNTMYLNFTGNGTTNNNRADGYGYDFDGNTTFDGFNSMAYDAENRIIELGNSSVGTVYYVYDANGRRVRKTVSGASVDYLYDLAGREIAEVNSSGGLNRAEVYAGPRHLVTYNNSTTYFNHSDWLGTERVRTNVGGTIYETCTSLVFGDSLICSTGDTSPMHFTGQHHDGESGFDDFGARYNSSRWGRFLSPDPLSHMGLLLDIHDPQSLNAYSYVRNNPLALIDPDGTNYSVCDQNGKNCADLTDKQYQELLASLQGTNVTVTPSGQIQAQNDNGSFSTIGTETHYNEQDKQAAGKIGQFAGPIEDLGIAEIVILAPYAPGALAGTTPEVMLGGIGFGAGGLVIGKMNPDATLKDGALEPGEYTLPSKQPGGTLPDQGSYQANWEQNSSMLRFEMSKGNPIRDVTAQKEGGLGKSNTGFLKAERNLLQSKGWSYSDGYWYPPNK